MVKNLEIRTFKSRFWMGRYLPSKKLILVREGLTEKEKAETLKHELEHHWFYTRTQIGKFLSHFYKRNVAIAYGISLALTWVLVPLAYLCLFIPFFLDNFHECCVSLKYPSRLSFTVSFIELIAFYSFFWIRLTL